MYGRVKLTTFKTKGLAAMQQSKTSSVHIAKIVHEKLVRAINTVHQVLENGSLLRLSVYELDVMISRSLQIKHKQLWPQITRLLNSDLCSLPNPGTLSLLPFPSKKLVLHILALTQGCYQKHHLLAKFPPPHLSPLMFMHNNPCCDITLTTTNGKMHMSQDGCAWGSRKNVIKDTVF